MKVGLFLLVLLFVLYPDPRFLLRDIHNLRRLQSLPDPSGPALHEVTGRFEAWLDLRGVPADEPAELLIAVQEFVYQEIPYGWDWEVWGAVNYVPTVEEVIERGREDCDGQAVVAAAILRERGIPADLVGDPRHMWVRTPYGETMNPLEDPVFEPGEFGMLINWIRLINFRALAFGIYVFPFWREVIVLLALVVLTMPERPEVRSTLAGTFLLFGALFLLRMAGEIHSYELTGNGVRGPTSHHAIIHLLWAALHIALGVLLIRRKAESTTEKTDPSVC